jgi:hypothetical protein
MCSCTYVDPLLGRIVDLAFEACGKRTESNSGHTGGCATDRHWPVLPFSGLIHLGFTILCASLLIRTVEMMEYVQLYPC